MADKIGTKRSRSENDLKLKEPDKKRKTSADENENQTKNQEQISTDGMSNVFDGAKEWPCRECTFLNRCENNSCEICDSRRCESTGNIEEANSGLNSSNESKQNLPCGIPDGASGESAGPSSTSTDMNANEFLRNAANIVELLKSELDQYQSLINDLKQITQNQGEIIPYPENWSGSINDNSLKLVPLDKEHPDYQFVINTAGDALKPYLNDIVSIQRIENWELYHVFAQRREAMIKKNGTVVINERWLWHGSNPSAIEKICRYGFDRSYSGGEYGMSGSYGVYFLPNFSTSLMYARPALSLFPAASTASSSDSHRKLLLCRVLTGNCTQEANYDDEGLGGPPLMEIGNRYDSACDSESSPNEFVVFQDHQAYPEYEITLNLPLGGEACIII